MWIRASQTEEILQFQFLIPRNVYIVSDCFTLQEMSLEEVAYFRLQVRRSCFRLSRY